MSTYQQLESKLAANLGLTRRPVAISITPERPANIAPFEGTVPSGCSFWRLASEGRTFATVQKDHYNCPIPQRENLLDVAIRGALARLPDNQRRVLELTKVEGKSTAEAGAILGTTSGAVKLRAHRAYETLRAMFG